MAEYRVQDPDGNIIRIQGPEGATDEQLKQVAAREYYTNKQIESNPTMQETAGVGEALVGGTKRFLSSIGTGLTAPFVGGEEAATRGIAREEKITERPGYSLENVKQAFKKDGLMAATSEAISQAPATIAEQSPILASIYAGFQAAKYVPGPAGVAARIVAPMLPIFFSMAGSNMQRKAEEDIAQGKPVDINEVGAYATSLAQTSLDRIGLALSGVSKLLGVSFRQAGTETAERIARQSVAEAIAKGTGKFLIAEVPTEMGQQVLERYYAGLPLTDEDAQKEYTETAFAVTLMGPIGSISGFKQRMDARKTEGVFEENPEVEKSEVKTQNSDDVEKNVKEEIKNQEIRNVRGEVNLDPKAMPSETQLTQEEINQQINQQGGQDEQGQTGPRNTFEAGARAGLTASVLALNQDLSQAAQGATGTVDDAVDTPERDIGRVARGEGGVNFTLVGIAPLEIAKAETRAQINKIKKDNNLSDDDFYVDEIKSIKTKVIKDKEKQTTVQKTGKAKESRGKFGSKVANIGITESELTPTTDSFIIKPRAKLNLGESNTEAVEAAANYLFNEDKFAVGELKFKREQEVKTFLKKRLNKEQFASLSTTPDFFQKVNERYKNKKAQSGGVEDRDEEDVAFGREVDFNVLSADPRPSVKKQIQQETESLAQRLNTTVPKFLKTGAVFDTNSSPINRANSTDELFERALDDYIHEAGMDKALELGEAPVYRTYDKNSKQKHRQSKENELENRKERREEFFNSPMLDDYLKRTNKSKDSINTQIDTYKGALIKRKPQSTEVKIDGIKEKNAKELNDDIRKAEAAVGNIYFVNQLLH